MTDDMGGEDLPELLAEIERFAEDAVKVAVDAVDEHGDARLPVLGGAGGVPDQLRADLVTQRGELERQRQHIAARQQELEKRFEAAMQAQRAQLRRAQAALEPLTKQLELLKQGIHLISLYLGEQEEIVTLAEGDPAPDDTPITIRQLVLYMDEECAVTAEAGGIEPTDVDVFDDWLIADPAHLAQVLPEPKGIVALTPRRHAKNYRDPWQQMARDEQNRVTYWLIRNGDRVWRMVTDLYVGSFLVARQDEFTRFFSADRWGRPLNPGTREWIEAEEKADLRQRHFMKVASVIQGLIDRTPLLRPLPAPDVSVLHPASYDAGHVTIIHDAEHALGDGRPSFREWQRDINSRLRVGMRVVAAFNSQGWRDANGHWEQRGWRHSRLHPETANMPPSNTPMVIEDARGDGDLIVRYDRTDEIWDDETYQYRSPKQRASVRIRHDDPFILAFDAADPDDIRHYMRDRASRADYVHLFPLLQAVLAAREAELDAEEPFRLLLAGRIADVHDVDLDTAHSLTARLVIRWKTANKYARPLVGDPAAEARALEAIVGDAAAELADIARRTDHADAEAAVVARLRADHPDVLHIARKRNGRYAAYLPAGDGVHVHRLDGSPAARSWTRTEWLLPSTHHLKWRTLHTTDTFTGWPIAETSSRNLTGPEIDDAVDRIINDPDRTHQVVAVTYQAERDHRRLGFYVLLDRRELCEADPHNPGGGAGVTIAERWISAGRRDGAVTLRPSKRLHSISWDERDGTDPVTQMHRDGRVVYRDENLAAELAGEARRIQVGVRRRRVLWSRARQLSASVSAAWSANAEADERDRFVAEYGDIDLWPAHAKTKDFRADHSTTGFVTSLIGSHLAHGLDPTGRTVAELHDHATANGWDMPREGNWPSKPWSTKPVPDGWADLTVTDPQGDPA